MDSLNHKQVVVPGASVTVQRENEDNARSVSRWSQVFVNSLHIFASSPIFWIGVILLCAPTVVDLATHDWGTEQGGHAPIVLATAIWLFALRRQAARLAMDPPRAWAAWLAVTPCLLLYCFAKITGVLELGGLAVYGFLVATLYALGGLSMIKTLGFPIFYCAFLIPLPESLIDTLTQPVKILISEHAVKLLGYVGFPVAVSGVSIYIGQFELFIAAACAGLNSLISLSAIGSLYVYLRRQASPLYMTAMIVLIVPVAVFSNFIRVVSLVLITYYWGEAAAQGFLHQFAGLLMFSVAVLMFFALDALFSRFVSPKALPS